MIQTGPAQICRELYGAESMKETGRPAGYERPVYSLCGTMEPTAGPPAKGPRPFHDGGSSSGKGPDGLWSSLEPSNPAAMEELRLEYSSQFWRMLLSGQPEMAARIYPKVKERGLPHKLNVSYKVAIAVWDPDEQSGGERPDAAKLMRISRLIQKKSGRITVVLNGRLVFILEAGAERDVLRPLIEQLTCLLGGKKVSLYLSRACPVGALADGYREAVSIARRSQKGGRAAVLPAENAPEACALLACLPDGPAADFTYRLLEPLKAYDRNHNSTLCATLKVYLQTGCNTKAAAQALYAHYNTVAYRLERIGEISGLDIKNVETRFSLRLAFKLEELREAVSEEG